jgi:hypothetical protein
MESPAGEAENTMNTIQKWERSKVATNLIYQAITDLRAELALLDSTIEQVEALAEDPPRKLRPRRLDANRPVKAETNGRRH